MSQLALLGLLVGIAAAVVLLDQLLLWMERRNWIYWRRRKRPGTRGGGGMGAVLTEFQQLVEPEVRHVIEAQDQKRAEIDERARRRCDDDPPPPSPGDPSPPLRR